MRQRMGTNIGTGYNWTEARFRFAEGPIGIRPFFWKVVADSIIFEIANEKIYS